MSDQEAAAQATTAVEAAAANNKNNTNTSEEVNEEVNKATKQSATAGRASAGGRVRGRDRRRVIHSDDDDDEEEEKSKEKNEKSNNANDIQDEQNETHKQKHKAENDEDEEEEEEEDKPRRGAGRTKAAPASRIRSSAPTAPPVAPPKMPSAFHVDPKNNDNNINSAGVSGESAAGTLGNEMNRTSSGAKVHFALPPQTQSGYSVEMVYKMDLDALTYAEMLKIITSITPDQVENKLAEREQEVQLIRQQKQSQRVEHFLDFLTNSVMVSSNSNGYSNGDVSTTTTNTENANNGISSSYDADSTNELAKKVLNLTGYTYNTMLSRLYTALDRSHEGSGMSERNKLPIPIIEKIGKKKTVISNFGRICKVFNRDMEDVKDFIEKELSITGNLDSNNALILKYEIRKATDFDNILVKYLEEYVKCNACNRIDTTLTKEGRRTELKCNWCTATRTVQAMGTATFRAALEKRSRQRATLTL